MIASMLLGFTCVCLVAFVSATSAHDAGPVRLLRPLPGSGIGSFLINTFFGYFLMKELEFPVYYDESIYHVFGRNGFWLKYFEDVGFLPSPSVASLAATKTTSKGSQWLTYFLPFAKKKKTSKDSQDINMFDPASRSAIMHLVLDSKNQTQNVHKICKHLKQFWRFNARTSAFIASHAAKLSSSTQKGYGSILLRGGDKLTLETFLSPPDVDLMTKQLTHRNITNVHVMTDSYPMYQMFLSKGFRSFSTVRKNQKGFYMSEVPTWSDRQLTHEILNTLLNYELARNASTALMTTQSNIGLWVNLLRLCDGRSIVFVDDNGVFPYFNSYIPTAVSA